jgi:hypothetical protein
MGGLIPKCLLLLLSLTAVVSAHPDSKLQSLHLTGKEKRELDTLGLQKRCTGSCSECFGDGYQECASSSSICFKPGDAQHGEDTCSSSGTVDSTTPTTPTSDFCTSGGCAACFGDGYQDCPDSSLYCYKPGDSLHGLDSCTSDTGSPTSSTTPDSSPSSADFNTTSTDFCDSGDFDCKRCFGQTYTPCPDSSQSASTNYCYDPNNSTSICPDGTTSGEGPGSSGTGSSLSSGSASYTASASSGATSTAFGAGSSSAIGASGSGASAINIQSSTTSASLRSTATTSGSQTSASSGGSNGSPISATTNGQRSAHDNVSGLLAVIASCFAGAAGLLV